MRVGIIGAGGIAGVHRRSYLVQDGVEIVGVADPSPAARDKAQTEWLVDAYENVDALLTGGAPDAVSICSPPKYHADIAIACLERGVAVLCEKPMGRTTGEAQQIADAAARTGATLMLAFCHRFHPPVAALKKALDAGRLGTVRMVRNRFGGGQDMTARWFSDPDVAGGGTLLDTAVHSVDLFRYLAGDAGWVDAATAAFAPGYRVEDSGIITLGAVGGALGIIEASWSTPYSANVLEVYGSEGAAVIDYNTGVSRIHTKADTDWQTLEVEGPDRFAAEVHAFLRAVRTRSAPPVTASDGVAANRILDAAYLSAKEGRRIAI